MRIISIDGGGYLGLATASFIAEAERHFRVRFSQEFDMFCGTSTGAIIALALANGRSGAEIVDLYKSLGERVFGSWSISSRCWRFARQLVTSRYGAGPLCRALREEFGGRTLGDLDAEGKRAIITAFCTTTGRPRVFKTPHAKRLTLDVHAPLWEVAMASASAPIFFPIHRMTNPENNSKQDFCDGGVAANHPALLGFTEAVCELGVPPPSVRLLSLATPRLDLGEAVGSSGVLRQGFLGWTSSIFSILIDANSFMTDELLKRLVTHYGDKRPVYVRQNMTNRLRLPIDRADEFATTELIQVGTGAATDQTVRDRLEQILAR